MTTKPTPRPLLLCSENMTEEAYVEAWKKLEISILSTTPEKEAFRLDLLRTGAWGADEQGIYFLNPKKKKNIGSNNGSSHGFSFSLPI